MAVGIEKTRRDDLVRAAIEEIGAAGTAHVTVGQIARRAGVSPALAFHYFGDKERLFLGAMRHILTIYAAEVRRHLSRAKTPRERLTALIGASFAPSNFERNTVNAWLDFYVTAQRNEAAARLLRVYRGRLRSNLVHELRACGVADPATAAEGLGAMIDGLYIRKGQSGDEREAARRIALSYLESLLKD
ncbi:transcriptional regulator BetI [Rhodobacterales bacterium HKCCE3408]|nr:transcriptional regulator BetI [Rhodobacterales bacterium HKCCE3408]